MNHRGKMATVCPSEQLFINLDAVRSAYGFGTGRFFQADGDGVLYDLTRVLDDNGEPIVDFGHEGTGTVPAAVIVRALSVTVEPQAR